MLRLLPAFLLCLPPFFAQAALSSEPTLEELVSFGVSNSPELHAAFQEWQGLTERVAQVRGLPDPQLSYAYMLERMETRQSLSLSQMFPGFGKRGLMGQAADRAAEAAGARVEATRWELMEQVRSQFSEVVFLYSAREAVQSNRDLLQRIQSGASRLYESGRGPYADVVRFQVELARLDDELRTLQEQERPRLRRLEALVGAAAGTIDGVSTDAPALETELPERATLQELLLRNSPVLRAARSEVEQRDGEQNLARRESYPDVMVGVEFMDNVGMAPDEVAVMASVNIPIWRGRIAAARREADRMSRSARWSREAVERGLLAEMEQNVFEVEDSRRKIALHDDELIPLAQQAAEAIHGSYLSGAGSFADFIDVQRTVLDLRIDRERLIASNQQALAALERLLGGWGENGE